MARGQVSTRSDGELDVYGYNVLGVAKVSGGQIRVAFKRMLTSAPNYQVLITGYSPTGKAFSAPRFGKHDGYFDVSVPSDWESFDFVVVGL